MYFCTQLIDSIKMEKFSKAFFSMRMMALAMLVFLLAIAAGTFLEAQYDIQTAKIIVYNAKWFEILLIYLGLNLIANIIRYQMFQRAKNGDVVFPFIVYHYFNWSRSDALLFF